MIFNGLADGSECQRIDIGRTPHPPFQEYRSMSYQIGGHGGDSRAGEKLTPVEWLVGRWRPRTLIS
jgi:hypothetical protein